MSILPPIGDMLEGEIASSISPSILRGSFLLDANRPAPLNPKEQWLSSIFRKTGLSRVDSKDSAYSLGTYLFEADGKCDSATRMRLWHALPSYLPTQRQREVNTPSCVLLFEFIDTSPGSVLYVFSDELHKSKTGEPFISDLIFQKALKISSTNRSNVFNVIYEPNFNLNIDDFVSVAMIRELKSIEFTITEIPDIVSSNFTTPSNSLSLQQKQNYSEMQDELKDEEVEEEEEEEEITQQISLPSIDTPKEIFSPQTLECNPNVSRKMPCVQDCKSFALNSSFEPIPIQKRQQQYQRQRQQFITLPSLPIATSLASTAPIDSILTSSDIKYPNNFQTSSESLAMKSRSYDLYEYASGIEETPLATSNMDGHSAVPPIPMPIPVPLSAPPVQQQQQQQRQQRQQQQQHHHHHRRHQTAATAAATTTTTTTTAATTATTLQQNHHHIHTVLDDLLSVNSYNNTLPNCVEIVDLNTNSNSNANTNLITNVGVTNEFVVCNNKFIDINNKCKRQSDKFDLAVKNPIIIPNTQNLPHFSPDLVKESSPVLPQQQQQQQQQQVFQSPPQEMPQFPMQQQQQQLQLQQQQQQELQEEREKIQQLQQLQQLQLQQEQQQGLLAPANKRMALCGKIDDKQNSSQPLMNQVVTPVMKLKKSKNDEYSLNKIFFEIPFKVNRSRKKVPPTGPYQCQWGDCTKLFATLPELTEHLQYIHIPNESSYTCLWRGCKRRGNPFMRYSCLTRHLRYHTGDKPCKCVFPGCKFSCVDNGDLKRHVKTVHQVDLAIQK